MKRVLLIALTMTSLSMMGGWPDWMTNLFKKTSPTERLIERGRTLLKNNPKDRYVKEALEDLINDSSEKIRTYYPEFNESQLNGHQRLYQEFNDTAINIVNSNDDIFGQHHREILAPRAIFLADYHQEMADRYKQGIAEQKKLKAEQEMIERRAKERTPVEAPTDGA